MRMSLGQVVEAVHGTQIPLAVMLREVTGVCTDTRALQPGDLFVALRGENFDGHDYVPAAFEKGAVAAIVNRSWITDIPANSGILITADDSLIALGYIARVWRRNFEIPVVGVTGSVGKTTTKEMLASALEFLGPVLKTDKNENNEIGVPSLLLKLTDEYRAVAAEMGMRGVGQIAYLAEIAEPTIGVITVIGENHIELLGSKERIVQAKGELIESLPVNGLAVLNRDDPYFYTLAAKAKCRVVSFGSTNRADIWASDMTSAQGKWSATAHYGEISGELIVPSQSRHDLINSLAAVLVAVELGGNLAGALKNVSTYKPLPMRMEMLKTASGATVLSDCYNASPVSMRSAIDTLASYPAIGRKIAFLGDMKELGDFAPEMHAEIAAHLEKAGISEAYAVGPMFGKHLTRAEKRFTDSFAAGAFASSGLQLTDGDVVLIKGSRAMAMERIVEALGAS